MRGRSDIKIKDEEDEAFLSAKESFLSALSREEPLLDSQSNMIFDDSAWQFLKHAVPGYAGFDEFSLPSLNLTKSHTSTTDT
eukprot:11878214-Ditylum_brightwellii.AAC.1